MPDAKPSRSKPTYPTHHWGAWAVDPWEADIVPDTPAWRSVMKHAWLRDGGTEPDFEALFGGEAKPRPREQPRAIRSRGSM